VTRGFLNCRIRPAPFDYNKRIRSSLRSYDDYPRQAHAQFGDLLLVVGTVKGAFIFLSNRARGDFKMSGPISRVNQSGPLLLSEVALRESSSATRASIWGALVEAPVRPAQRFRRAKIRH